MTEEEKEIGIQDVRRLLKKAKEDYNRSHPDNIYKVALERWSDTQDILDVLSGDDERFEKIIDYRIELATRKNAYSRLIIGYQSRPVDGPYHKPNPVYMAYALNIRLLGE